MERKQSNTVTAPSVADDAAFIKIIPEAMERISRL